MRADEAADREHAALIAFQTAYGGLCTAMALALFYGKDRMRVKAAGAARNRYNATDKWLRGVQDRRAMANLALDTAKVAGCTGSVLRDAARDSRDAIEREWDTTLPLGVTR